MRLICVTDFSLIEFNSEEVPPYAILSHRWREDELTFQDVESGNYSRKLGFRKIKEACRIAARSRCKWLWVDTCCIDKRNAVELNEAINAMYRWYQRAHICIAYLFDHTNNVNSFSKSTWFQRCWTLQELIAPADVKFYDSRWNYIGSKATRCSDIAQITNIPERVLKGADPRQCSVAQRMSWAANRKATRPEDSAYSLLGLFNLSLPTLYGSGGPQAFQALQEKLLQKHDQSILAWDRITSSGTCEYKGLLAESPADFASCRYTRSTESPIGSIMLVGDGVELEADTIPYTMGVYLCALDSSSSGPDRRDAILVQQLDTPQQYARILDGDASVISVSRRRLVRDKDCKRRKLYIYHELRHAPLKVVRGFNIEQIDLLDRHTSAYDKIRISSRLNGEINPRQSRRFVQLPKDEYGTAGLLYFPHDQRAFRHWPIRWIKLGFNTDFSPMIRFGNKSQTSREISRATEHNPAPGTEDYDEAWNNHWLNEKLAKREKLEIIYHSGDRPNEDRYRELTRAEYFEARGFEQHTVQRTDGAFYYGEYTGLEFALTLEDCPRTGLPAHLSVAGPGPWKIWTLEIREIRDFASERQQRHTLYTLGGAAALGLLSYGLVSDHIKKKKAGAGGDA